MNAPKLKINLINRIIEIDDIVLLKSLESLFSTSDKNISKFLELANEKMQQENENETEDFTAYIKEWVKNM
jgi:hemerythrin-like domain-containing protein